MDKTTTKRTHGPASPHLVERLDPHSPIYAVRWDVQPNAGGQGSGVFGANYLEAVVDHCPTLSEIRELIGDWSDRLVQEAILTGMEYEGEAVWLSAENQMNYAADYALTISTGGANLPVTVRLGSDAAPTYRTFLTVEGLEAFVWAVRTHINQCILEGWLRKENVDYLLYEEYLKAEETMTPLEKAKAEKKLEVLRQREAQEHYYLDGVDVYATSYQRGEMRKKANRGETVEMQTHTVPADVALRVLDQMESYLDQTDETYTQKLRAVELAETEQDTAALNATDGYPALIRTTVTSIQQEIETERANSPEVQAVLFAKQMINDVPMTATLALKRRVLFPVWGEEGAEMGRKVPVGFRFQYEGTLYEVIQEHQLQADWTPGMDTASLYKVVTAEHAGTLEDPIPDTQGMAFEEGKYYTEDGILYRCILTTQTGYPNDLKDLPTIVEPVLNEE